MPIRTAAMPEAVARLASWALPLLAAVVVGATGSWLVGAVIAGARVVVAVLVLAGGRPALPDVAPVHQVAQLADLRAERTAHAARFNEELVVCLGEIDEC